MPEKKPGKTSKFSLRRTCPGCNKEFNMSEVAWVTNPRCFMNNSEQCPLVQAQKMWLTQNQPIEDRLQTAEGLYEIGNDRIANKVLNELFQDMFD
jgi:hypothetical protein